MARTLKQLEHELINTRHHRERARHIIEQRLDQVAALRIQYAAYGTKLDQLLDEQNALLALTDLEEAA